MDPASRDGLGAPWTVRLALNAFMAVFVPVYLSNYGWRNFFYLCDVALFLTWYALVFDDPVASSVGSLVIVVPQLLWNLDLMANLFFGMPLTGLASYMLAKEIPLFTRLLASFHSWLPFLLLYLNEWLGGYRQACDRDRCAWIVEIVSNSVDLIRKLSNDRVLLDKEYLNWLVLSTPIMATVTVSFVLMGSYLVSPLPMVDKDHPEIPRNINFIYGFAEDKPNKVYRPLWLMYLVVLQVVFFIVPTHLVLSKLVVESSVLL